MSRLSELVAPVQRLAVVGLAKNTGKTQALTCILAEHAQAGGRVGVTSIGRDGEEHDVIDARIDKPRIALHEGSLVASTDALMRTSGVGHERVARTGVRTPLGEVVIARLLEHGRVEVAGPSTAEQLRQVSDAMVREGVEQVLIDGSIDRRAASAPAVADGLVVATGAVLGEDIETVVARTVDAIEVIRLPVADHAAHKPAVDDTARQESIRLTRELALNADPAAIAKLVREHPEARTLLIDGALSERFLQGLIEARRAQAGRSAHAVRERAIREPIVREPAAHAVRERAERESIVREPAERELRVVARDPTKVFMAERSPSWYRRQGIAIEVLQTVDLRAITVNPVAPRSHRLDSGSLRKAIESAIPDVPVLDVLDPVYLADAK